VTAAGTAPTDVLARLADRFDEDGLPYAVGGALALGAWGVPRTTSDVDVSVFVNEKELDGLLDSVERAGAIVERAEARQTVARAGFFVAYFGRTRICSAHDPRTCKISNVCLPSKPGVWILRIYTSGCRAWFQPGTYAFSYWRISRAGSVDRNYCTVMVAKRRRSWPSLALAGATGARALPLKRPTYTVYEPGGIAVVKAMRRRSRMRCPGCQRSMG